MSTRLTKFMDQFKKACLLINIEQTSETSLKLVEKYTERKQFIYYKKPYFVIYLNKEGVLFKIVFSKSSALINFIENNYIFK